MMERPLKRAPLLDLVQRAREGDADARTEVLRRGAGWLAKVIPTRGFYLPSGGDNDDLVQEGLKGWNEAVDKWRPDWGNFVPFAAMLAMRDVTEAVKTATRKGRRAQNEALSYDAPMRSNAKGQDGELRAEVMELPDASGLGVDPAAIVVAEVSPLLAALLAPLSQLERRAVEATFLAGRSWKEAQALLHVSEASLDAALMRAKKKIRRTAAELAAAQDSELDPADRYTLRRLVATGRGSAA